MTCEQGFQFGTLSAACKYSKYVVGYDNTLKAIREGTAKLILVSRNVSFEVKSQVEMSALLANVEVEYFDGNKVVPHFGFNHMWMMAITDVEEAASMRLLLNNEERQKNYGFF